MELTHQLIRIDSRAESAKRATTTITARTKCGVVGSVTYPRTDSFASVGLSVWTSDVNCPACLGLHDGA